MTTVVSEKYKLEASEKGLIFLGDSEKSGTYRRYRFVGCLHEKDIKTSHVRSGNFRCSDCIREKIESFANSAGLDVLDTGNSCAPKHTRCRFRACGHEQDIRRDKIINGSFICKQCKMESLVNDANSAGLVLIGKSVRGKDYRKYRFLSCGHISDFSVANVRAKNVRCGDCILRKREDSAARVGLEIVGKSKLSTDYLLYKLPCGHVQDFSIQNVSNKEFSCFECGEHSWTKPSRFYTMKISSGSFSWLKIGYTNSIDRRLRQYGLPQNSSVEVIYDVSFSSAKLASGVETQVFERLSNFKINPQKMQQYHTRSGYTECYEIEAIPKIQEVLNAI